MSKGRLGISSVIQRLIDEASTHPYWAIGLMVGLVTAIGFAVVNLFRPANVEALYLVVVFASALKWGRQPALFAALTSTLALDFCFVPPRFHFAVTDLAFVVTLLVFFFVAITTSELVVRAHELIREKAAREQAQAQAQAKEILLDKISHELRSPLTTILLRLHLLRQSAEDAPRTERGLAAMERNTQRLARLVGDLLDVSSMHMGKLRVCLQPLALAPVVSRVLEDAAIAAAEKGVPLQWNVEPVGTVQADESRIEQIVTNLVSNAVKFTPASGRVTVTLSETNGCARLVVADTGEGIPSAFIPRLFEPFSQGQTHSSQQGLGLGLAIVKHLIDGHHGRISVKSEGRGRGTTVVVEFPLRGSASIDDSSTGDLTVSAPRD